MITKLDFLASLYSCHWDAVNIFRAYVYDDMSKYLGFYKPWNILNIFLFDNISSGKQELCLILFQLMGLFPRYSSFELDPNSVHSGHLYGHC